jgi:aspartyl-tRNA(Asn)/glutamyl-tRNA(Gln) amidotransferase subunit B
MDYDVIICFETHVELKTKRKLFCDCFVSYEEPPNSQVCPVCTGQPGALPVLNKKAVEFAIRTGLALNCSINRHSRFARKNYFYPDLPKGYQISQYDRPFCENGFLEISEGDGRPYAVGIKRVHLEEDAGKLVHSSSSFEASDYSLVDYNRSSVPLLEIVADHERNPLRSVREARIYLEKLRQTLRYIGVSDCIIEKGQFRCDVNISLRPKGTETFGNRAEIKNMGSFRFIMDALEYEIKRQSEILESGESVPQETRLFDEQKKITLPMRSKEDAPDYRYFPDPDLVEIEIDQHFVQRIKETMTELPDQKVDRIIQQYHLSREDALILTKNKDVSDYFESCAAHCRDWKRLSHWMLKDLFKLLNDTSKTIEECPISPEHFSQLVNLMTRNEITENIGRTVLEEMFKTGAEPESIIQGKGLKPIQDTDTLMGILDKVTAAHPDVVKQIKAGVTKPIGFLIGQVMNETGGKANPKVVKELILHTLRPEQDS